MTSIARQLVINNINLSLPKEIIDIVKDYTFHRIKKISENDVRYDILLDIPYKEYNYTHDISFVYLSITHEKDYYLVYKNFEIQIQTLKYVNDNEVQFLDGSIFLIE
jgi:hypothetical protein